MGIESKFYLLAASSGYRPIGAEVARLIEALRAAGYLPNTQPVWKTGDGGKESGPLAALEARLPELAESDLVIEWHNPDLQLSGLRYPLDVVPGSEAVYYTIEIHLAADTIYHTSETVDPFVRILCPCGTKIESFESSRRNPLHDSRLPNHCPACHVELNYATQPMTFRDAWTGEESVGSGGVTYRFAVVVDCGKYWPPPGATAAPEFRAVSERTLGIATRVVRDFY